MTSVRVGMSVEILSAFVPTLIAQRSFRPAVFDEEVEDALGAGDVTTIRRR
ncbi:MAG TPA: hypothetical protein VLX89_11800 [Actinomycetota bacterium]|nr:hypothetical protein [Actinomycetota bacterium]